MKEGRNDDDGEEAEEEVCKTCSMSIASEWCPLAQRACDTSARHSQEGRTASLSYMRSRIHTASSCMPCEAHFRSKFCIT